MGSTWIAMSGGVDSAVAAYLLHAQGETCKGVLLRMIGSALCPDKADGTAVSDARAVADTVGIPFSVIDCEDAFRAQVVEPFVASYRAGKTPNPCLFCNRALKFGYLLDVALQNGADRLATGHYARIGKQGDRYLLQKAADPAKDQSYVLYALTQEQLAHLCFPLGGLSKSEIRAIAAERGFINAHKQESQDICFIPDGDHAAFIERYTGEPSRPGDFVTRDGTPLGKHRGLIRYTVGQRKGLGLSLPEPYYVCGKDASSNRVVLCTKSDLPVKELIAVDFNWVSIAPPVTEIRASVRVRYHQVELPATLIPEENGTVRIRFDGSGTPAAPGQAAVAYDGDTLLGGGVIA